MRDSAASPERAKGEAAPSPPWERQLLAPAPGSEKALFPDAPRSDCRRSPREQLRILLPGVQCSCEEHGMVSGEGSLPARPPVWVSKFTEICVLSSPPNTTPVPDSHYLGHWHHYLGAVLLWLLLEPP